MIDEKYTAGFVDADGSIGIHPVKLVDGSFRIHAKLQLGQLAKNDQTLRDVAEEYDVAIRPKVQPNGAIFHTVDLVGTKATMLLDRIGKHLVIKDELAKYVVSLNGSTVNGPTLKSIKQVVKLLRKKDVPTKKHPSRKWMAGYVDGDGCFYARVGKNGVLNSKLVIATSADALAGISLVQKAFGGHIRTQGRAAYLEVYLSSTKIKELYAYFGTHLRNKKSQMLLAHDFIGSGKHSRARGATLESLEQFCEVLSTTKSIGLSYERML